MKKRRQIEQSRTIADRRADSQIASGKTTNYLLNLIRIELDAAGQNTWRDGRVISMDALD